MWDDAFTALQRPTTSPDNVVRFLAAFAILDVFDLAAWVRCPTLLRRFLAWQPRTEARAPPYPCRHERAARRR